MSRVLERLLRQKSESDVVEKFFSPAKRETTKPKRPGRPKVAREMKARNFTLCLKPEFVNFLDKMTVKDPKIKGRGRKIRFIIERFIEHEKRSLGQMKVLKDALLEVQTVLQSFRGRVKKGQRLELTVSEKKHITKVVDRVFLIMKILNYTPKSLHKLLAKEDWAILSFCLDWKQNKGVHL